VEVNGEEPVKGKDELAFAYVIRLHFMRVRILSESEQQTNLPQIRSWFNVDKENTVASLKLGLCASVPALRDAQVRTTELVLTLDGFELLDDSSIHVLRDGDLIWYVERHIPYLPYMTSVKVCIAVRIYPSAAQRWLKMRHGKGNGNCPVQVALLAVGLLSTAQVEMTSIIR
jgi:hypothetical protein